MLSFSLFASPSSRLAQGAFSPYRKCHKRRQLNLALTTLTAACYLSSSPVLAQTADSAASWPDKAVRVINPFPPGGASDLLARMVGETLQRELKQSFIIDNRPGAGGNIGADAVAKAAGDGYTLLLGLDTITTVNPFIFKSMSFKASDLRPLMVVASQGLLVSVNPKTGIKTMDQFIAKGKQQPLMLSSGGYGNPGHLASAILTHETGAKVTLVPYKGNAPATTAILAGEVDGGIVSSTAMLGHIAAGKVTPLAFTTAKRNPLAPNVPTVGELGYKNLEQGIYFVAWAPASMPDAVAQKIETALSHALQDSKLRERMRINDLNYEGQTGEAAAKFLQSLTSRYENIISATGMKME